jgi:hypothetical protein
MISARRSLYSQEAQREAGLGSLFTGLSMILLGLSLVPLILNADAIKAGVRWPLLPSVLLFCCALIPSYLFVVHYRRFRRLVRRDKQGWPEQEHTSAP